MAELHGRRNEDITQYFKLITNTMLRTTAIATVTDLFPKIKIRLINT